MSLKNLPFFRTFASLFSGVLSLLGATANAGAFNEHEGYAIKGYDPVAYFVENKAVAGVNEFKADYKGSTFRFKSAANRDTFNANPEKYQPQYGGYCAYGTSKGYKADIDPRAFSIVEGKLYLNYNTEIQATWSKDIPGYIKKADAQWPAVEKTTKVYR